MSDQRDGAPIYDEAGREIGWAAPIRTQYVEPTPPPPDHPSWEQEPSLLVPRPGDLIRATELPRGRG